MNKGGGSNVYNLITWFCQYNATSLFKLTSNSFLGCVYIRLDLGVFRYLLIYHSIFSIRMCIGFCPHFLKRWIVSMFSWLVQPQSCIRYTKLVWWWNLFFVERTEFLPMTQQYILDNFRSSSTFFFLMCSFHLSLTSSVISRYLAVFECGTTMWSIYTFWCDI